MKITSRILILICGLILANSVFATTSTCYEYYIGSTPYVAHQSTYSSGDAAFGPTFGMKTEVIYPSLPVINSYWPASSSGGSQTIADTPYYAGYWAWLGAAAIGVYNGDFYYETPTFSSCSHNQTYGKPTSVYVDINPTTAYEGQTVLFSWGASGVVNQCTLGGSPLSPTQGSNVPVVVSLGDAGTYTVYCSNYWGQSTSPGQDTLTVNQCSDPGILPFLSYNLTEGTSPSGTAIGQMSLVSNPSIDVTAYCSGSVWKIRVTQASQPLRIDINLANQGITQITTSAINSASCTLLETMKTTIEEHASSPYVTFTGGYFHTDAVLAHETVHKNRYTNAFDPYYSSFRNYLETDSVFQIPIDSAANPAAAKAAITAKSEYIGELGGFNVDVNTAFNSVDNHSPSSDFVVPQQNAVATYIAQIDTRLSSCP